MYRLISYIYIITALFTGIALFFIKNEVQNLRFQESMLLEQESKERGSINLLKAELSYLTSPKRLKILSDKYLSLATVSPSQVVHDPLLSESEIIKSDRLSNVNLARSAREPKKWRYKRVNNGIRIASYKKNEVAE